LPKLNIPESYRPGLSLIRKLDERSVRDLRLALDQATDTSLRPDVLAASAVSSISHANVEEFREIADTVGTMYSVRMLNSMPLDDFVQEICEVMSSLDSQELRVPESERASFREKLLTVFGSKNFETVAKAWDLKTDDERVFCGARIITDMRPFSARA